MQGDILSPSPELKGLFKSENVIHDPRYMAYIVTTQNCDLVPRNNDKCDAEHINLSAVMSLQTFLPSLLDIVCQRVCEKGLDGAYIKKGKEDAKNWIRRIINQNAWKYGLFYLHNDVGAGIDEPAVALLRVCTTVILTKKNYKLLKKAREGRLDDLFQAKLGWTVGNLYSRIGTPDWGEEYISVKKELIEKLLDPNDYKWVPKSWVKAARNKGVNLEELPLDNILKVLEQHKPSPFYQEVAKRVKTLVEKQFPQIPPIELDAFEKKLLGDLLIKSIKHPKEL